MITTTLDEERNVHQVFFGEHLIHECDASCEDASKKTADALTKVIDQYHLNRKWYRRLWNSPFVRIPFFVFEATFLWVQFTEIDHAWQVITGAGGH